MTVSFCVIAYNEERALPRLLEDIREQDYPAEQMEVVLVDSLSTDGTLGIMEAFARENPQYRRVQVLINRGGNQASGWNVAIRHAREEIVIRVDAHARIPREFVSANVRCQAEGEYVTGGPRPNIAEDPTPWQETLLLAESSMFGSGIAGYRRQGEKKYVKSLFHGAYRREVFEKTGLFDEQLGRTEDNEMHYRIRKAGYRICFDPRIRSWQYTRSSLRGMMKQKYGNGCWVALTLKACPECLSLYHFVPLGFVSGILFTGALAVRGRTGLAKLLWGAYSCLALVMSGCAVRGKKKNWRQLSLPVLFLLLHVSYGAGSLAGLLKLPFWKYHRETETIDGKTVHEGRTA